jgi:hypothetical protein
MIKLGILAFAGGSWLLGMFAQQDPISGVDWGSEILKGGPAALVVFLLIIDKLCTPGERDRLRTELTASHLREEALNEFIRKEHVPLMTKNIEANTKVLEILADEERFPPKAKR